MHFKLWLSENKFNLSDLAKMTKKTGIDISKYDKQEVLDGINTEKKLSCR
jgi:hypothetical protein